MRNTTIYDVAGRAHVSVATVSRYLKGQQVRARVEIEAAILELGFRPQPAAQSLKSGSTSAIAVVIPDIQDPYFASVVKGIETVARSAGYHVFLYNSDEDGELEGSILRALWGRVDGVILTPADESSAAHARMSEMKIPTVLLDRAYEGELAVDAVLIDNVGGAAAAADHLLTLNHQRIGLISGPLDTTPGRTRHDGFIQQLRASDLEIPPDMVEIADFRESGGYEATLRLMGNARPPTALFVTNNLMSVGCLKALLHLGLQVPDDVSVVGFDDLQLAELIRPPLTVVSRPTSEQGALAARLLVNRLQGFGGGSRRISLETSLLIRGSTSTQPLNRTKKGKNQ